MLPALIGEVKMTVTEFLFLLTMLNICIVSFVWILKQIIQLGYWYYKREENKSEQDS